MQRLARAAAAFLLLTGGAIHLDLWRGGYQGIRFIGPLFLANVAASVALAFVVSFRRDTIVIGAAAAFAAGSLIALTLSRTVGLLGFMESQWTDRSLAAVAAEVATIVALAVVYVSGRTQASAGGRPQPVGQTV